VTQDERTSGEDAVEQPGDTPERASPWRTLGTREVYRNPWMTVHEHNVVRPDGTRGIYGVVEPGDNAAIVALDDAARICLIEEYVYPLQRFERLIPSGRVDEGETPLAAARRELAEETGIAAREWAPLGAYYLSAGISPQTSHIFLARGLTLGQAQPEGTERITLRWLPLAAAHDACLRGAIRDAPSVLGIWRAWLLLRDDPALP
jgi:8-oxo-dGTP pyrophosphatase MutT (NUDIX family)